MYLTGITLKRRQKNRYLPDTFVPSVQIQVASASEFQATNGADYVSLANAVISSDTTQLTELVGDEFQFVGDAPTMTIPLVMLDSVSAETDTGGNLTGTYKINLRIVE